MSRGVQGYMEYRVIVLEVQGQGHKKYRVTGETGLGSQGVWVQCHRGYRVRVTGSTESQGYWVSVTGGTGSL